MSELLKRLRKEAEFLQKSEATIYAGMSLSSILDEYEEEQKQLVAWKEAVEDRFIANYLEWDDADPHGSLNKLFALEYKMTLDCRISSGAQELYDQGFQDGMIYTGPY